MDSLRWRCKHARNNNNKMPFQLRRSQHSLATRRTTTSTTKPSTINNRSHRAVIKKTRARRKISLVQPSHLSKLWSRRGIMQSISGQYKNKNNHCNICLFPVKIDYRGWLPIDHNYITLVRSSQPSIRVLQTLPPRGESNRIEQKRNIKTTPFRHFTPNCALHTNQRPWFSP